MNDVKWDATWPDKSWTSCMDPKRHCGIVPSQHLLYVLGRCEEGNTLQDHPRAFRSGGEGDRDPQHGWSSFAHVLNLIRFRSSFFLKMNKPPNFLAFEDWHFGCDSRWYFPSYCSFHFAVTLSCIWPRVFIYFFYSDPSAGPTKEAVLVRWGSR